MVDVAVVGAGPVGMATALALARRGMVVTLVESRRGAPLDKACGEGLMPDALESLREVGVDLAPGGWALRGIRYLDERHQVAAGFPFRGGRGVRRLELSERFTRAVAAQPAIEPRRGVRAELVDDAAKGRWGLALRRGPGAAEPAEVLWPRWIVAADGLRSPLRRQCGLAAPAGAAQRFGARVHFEVAPWSDEVEVYWLDGLEAYVTPVAEDVVGLAILWWRRGERAGFEQHLERVWRAFPSLHERLAGAPRASAPRGAGPLHQRVRAVVDRNLLLVGDASGYLDAITGEGMALGFADALAVAEALDRGRPALYARLHRRRRRVPLLLMHAALQLSRRPRLRRGALRLLAARPGIFARLLALHVGESGAALRGGVVRRRRKADLGAT
ncbi:MAG: FAD-dependent monooxygenase [Acidobacteria bacterium]|nr:MAG: FAD-dependent monooxygenase [Acidobacteriota bacterium]REJ99583.1 MAG: FAD-dependent monooxygenase [Acidobacteriota bacterium]